MEFRHLRYLVAIAEEMSFTRAAARLHTAQPALSVQIRQLEDELEVELIDRSRRAIALTEAGAIMVAEARELLRARDRAIELVRKTGTGTIGKLAVGFVPSASNVTLPPLLRAFTTTHPDVTLTLREMAPDLLVTALREGRLDVCFLYLPFDDASMARHVVSREEFVLALPADHRLVSSARVQVSDLRDEAFVMPARHGMPGLNAQVLGICHDAGFEPNLVQDDVWLVQTIVGLVAAGSGVALVPANAKALSPAGVVYRSLSGVEAHLAELAAVWRHEERSPVLMEFISGLRAGPLRAPVSGLAPGAPRGLTGADRT
jgi:DNA-binding transcriptional LysR family regulator